MSTYPLRVLVCEGRHLQGGAIANALRQLGCREVLLANDSQQAIELLKDVGPVDVALVDLETGGMDCLDFLQALGYSELVESVAISSVFAPELSRVIGEIVTLQGLRMLGEIDASPDLPALAALLEAHRGEVAVEPAAQPVPESASDHDLRHALADQQFRTWFQPKFNLRTGAIHGVEALVRWHHPVLGILPPSQFLPALERLGLMDNLLAIQLQRGLELQQRAERRGHCLNVAFNIEAAQLACADFSERISRALARHQRSGMGLTFELTERTALETSAVTLNNLVRLRLLGCELSIDDFGSGFSSLQRLCELPFTEIKLDRIFAQGFLADPSLRAATVHTLALGEMLEMPVVIEGIETEVQRQALANLGGELGQGYVCAQPMLEGPLLELLERGNYFEANHGSTVSR